MTKAEIIESLLVQAEAKKTLSFLAPYRTFAYDATVMFEAAELLKSAPKWVSVEERLPSEAKVEKFLVAIEGKAGRTVEMARYMNGHLTLLAFEDPDGIITHWMALPDPPKGGVV